MGAAVASARAAAAAPLACACGGGAGEAPPLLLLELLLWLLDELVEFDCEPPGGDSTITLFSFLFPLSLSLSLSFSPFFTCIREKVGGFSSVCYKRSQKKKGGRAGKKFIALDFLSSCLSKSFKRKCLELEQ
jgi:hypothetical protein